MDRCASCRFWLFPHSAGDQDRAQGLCARLSVDLYCDTEPSERFSAVGAARSGISDVLIRTRADFGCVEHEAKPK